MDGFGFQGGGSSVVNPVGGTGTLNYLAKFTAASTIGDSIVSESGTNLSIAGTVVAGTWGAGAVIAGATMTLGSDATGDVYYRSAGGVLSRLAAGAAGTFLRFAGAATIPVVSTLVLPNAATTGNIVRATSTNTLGSDSGMTYGLSAAGVLAVNSGGFAHFCFGAANTATLGWIGGAPNYPLNVWSGNASNVWMSVNVNGDTSFASGSALFASAKVHIVKTTEQLRVGYDASNYYTHTVDSNGRSLFNNSGVSQAYHYSMTGTVSSAAKITMQVFNSTAGTATNLYLVTSFSNPDGNSAINAFSSPTTTGYNIANYCEALGGAINIGVVGKAITAKNSATNIGVIGIANNTGSSPIFIGGYFGVAGSDTPTFTGLTAALVASNGGTATPVFIGLYDTSNYYSAVVSSAGLVTFDAVGSSSAFVFSDSVGTAGITPLSGLHSGTNTAFKTRTSAAGTLTLGAETGYVATGTTATFSLPAIAAGVVDRWYPVKNRGSGNLTVDVTGGASTIWDTAAVASVTILAGGAATFYCDGSYWNLM